jgi:hypothetical protein
MAESQRTRYHRGKAYKGTAEEPKNTELHLSFPHAVYVSLGLSRCIDCKDHRLARAWSVRRAYGVLGRRDQRYNEIETTMGSAGITFPSLLEKCFVDVQRTLSVAHTTFLF